jgi:hypothetical protein
MVRMEDAPVDVVLQHLVARSRELDPGKAGMPDPLVVLPHPQAGHPLAYLPYAQAPFAALATASDATATVSGRDVTIALGPAAAAVAAPAAAMEAMPADADAAVDAEVRAAPEE